MATESDDDVGIKWEKASEVCDATVDRCWEIINDDAVTKKLTPAELESTINALETAWHLMDHLMGPDEGDEKEDEIAK